MRFNKLILGPLLLGLFVTSSSYGPLTFAHRAHFGWTNISSGADSVEIIHRVHEHDAARWLSDKAGHQIDITSLEQQAKFALYIAEHFSLSDGNSRLLPDLVGAELIDRYLLIYQELPLASISDELIIDSEILMDLHSDQIHVIDIKMLGSHRTIEFSSNTQPQSVVWDHASTH